MKLREIDNLLKKIGPLKNIYPHYCHFLYGTFPLSDHNSLVAITETLSQLSFLPPAECCQYALHLLRIGVL